MYAFYMSFGCPVPHLGHDWVLQSLYTCQCQWCNNEDHANMHFYCKIYQSAAMKPCNIIPCMPYNVYNVWAINTDDELLYIIHSCDVVTVQTESYCNELFLMMSYCNYKCDIRLLLRVQWWWAITMRNSDDSTVQELSYYTSVLWKLTKKWYIYKVF